MYTCPTDDIHSIYADGELPEIFVPDYKAHIESCPACAKKLERLLRLRGVFKSDSDMLSLDNTAMEESFKRLNTKLRYSKNTVRFSGSGFSKTLTTAFGGIAAAAAAVFALVIPLRAAPEQNAAISVSEVASIAVPQIAFPERNVVITGNIAQDFTQNVSAGRMSSLPEGDFFRPDFSDENRLYIRIAAPGTIFDAEASDMIGMKLPINAVSDALK